MTGRARSVLCGWIAAAGLAACHTPTAQEAPSRPPPVPPASAPAPAEASPAAAEPAAEPAPPAAPEPAAPRPAAPASPPPCSCTQAPAPVHHVHKRKKKETPQGPEPPQPVPAPKPDEVVDAEVGQMAATLTSILGKDVKSPTGEDMGRVVDVLADTEGHVRVAIIDFGGFLGVGTRRIAVDWPLLHFNPNAGDKWLILSVTRQKLQSTPEYKDPNSPRVLMPPAAPPNASDTGQTKK